MTSYWILYLSFEWVGIHMHAVHHPSPWVDPGLGAVYFQCFCETRSLIFILSWWSFNTHFLNMLVCFHYFLNTDNILFSLLIKWFKDFYTQFVFFQVAVNCLCLRYWNTLWKFESFFYINEARGKRCKNIFCKFCKSILHRRVPSYKFDRFIKSYRLNF